MNLRPCGYKPCGFSGDPVDLRRLAALPALVRAFLAHQPTCHGAYHYPRGSERQDVMTLPVSPCALALRNDAPSNRLATHHDHDPEDPTPRLCEECAKWLAERDEDPPCPRKDLADLQALIAAVEGL